MPSQVTSMRSILNTSVAITIISPTSTSRASTATPNQIGIDPSIMIATIATMNSSRSAVGSNTLPNSLTWFSRRAR